ILFDSHGRRICEGAQHAGDIPKRAVTLPALGERPSRLTFEIENHVVTIGLPEDLPEMVIAVVADPRAGARAEGGEELDCAIEKRIRLLQHHSGLALPGTGQRSGA